MSDKLTALESGLALIYGTFLKYASSEEGDDPTTISKKELCQMIAEQLPHLAGVSNTSSIAMLTCIYLFDFGLKEMMCCTC
jgi:hypothetical protein